MKTLLLIVGLSFLQLITSAQVTVDWYNYPNGVSVATDNQNNVYTAYWDYNPAGDITLTKRNATGTVLWSVPYNNTDNTRHEVATWVDVDNAGNIVVSGTIRSGYSNPVNAASVLMKFNPSGTLLWRVVYENSFDGSSTRKCLIDAANNIYVLGIGTGPNGQVTKVKKFDPSGNTVWNYFDPGYGAPVNFKFTPDNKILIVHRSITGSMNGFSKIDLNGNNIWGFGGIVSLGGGDAAGDAFGNTYMINGSVSGSVLTKLNPAGVSVWTQSNTQSGNKVEVGSDNKPVVGGYPFNSYGVVMMKYDTSGVLLWQNLDADGPALGLLALTPMKMDAANAIYIAGSTMSQMGVCKVNSNGTSAWAATTPSGYPSAFVLGTDNNVYVTGGTTARFLQTPPVAPCLPPSGLSVTNITTGSAKLNWTSVPNIVRYLVLYKQSTDSVWKRVYVSKTKTFVTINNLVCGAAYKWKIRTVCDTAGVDIVSAFSPVKNFSTAACRLADASTLESTALDLYPNPVKEILTVTYTSNDDRDVQIEMLDMTGRVVGERKYFACQEGENQFQIDISDFIPGMYVCRLYKDKQSYPLRFLKE
jgi:hypothetical protein